MKIYVWLTFAVMGWGYYEMSGGSDFVPEQTALAGAQTETPEIVTRATQNDLLAIPSTTDVSAQVSDVEVTQAVARAVALDTVEAETPEPEVTQVVAPVIENTADIREVAGSRVNMRVGPGTGFDVITTLDSGTQLEVLEVNAEGWANVATVDRRVEGWMAERLLTDNGT